MHFANRDFNVCVPGEELLSELQCVLHPNVAALPEAGLRPAAHRLQ